MAKDPLNPLTKLVVPVGIGESVEIAVHDLGAVYVKGGDFIEANHPIPKTAVSLMVSSASEYRHKEPGLLAKITIGIEKESDRESFTILLMTRGNNLVFVTQTGANETELLSVPLVLDDRWGEE